MADHFPNESNENSLTPARPEEVAEALSYALRYDERGRPRPHGGEMVAGLAAQHLTQHLERAGFVLMRKPTRGRPHSVG